MSLTRGSLPIASALLLVACNSVTSADGIEFVDGAGGSGESVATSGSSALTAATTTAASGQTSTASAGGSDASVAVASSSSGPACVYPEGPYGVSLGKVIPKNLKWQGYLAGGNDQGTLTTEELFDCDGTKGINAILFDTSQFG